MCDYYDTNMSLITHCPISSHGGVHYAVQENTAVAFNGTSREEGCSTIVMVKVWATIKIMNYYYKLLYLILQV